MGNNFLEHSKTIRVDLKKLQAVQLDSNSYEMLQDYLNEKKGKLQLKFIRRVF